MGKKQKNQVAKTNGETGDAHEPQKMKFPSEELRWKLGKMQVELERVTERLRTPLAEEIATKLRVELNRELGERLPKVLRNDPAWLKAKKARDEVVEEVDVALRENIPEEYIITSMLSDDNEITAMHNPEISRKTMRERLEQW